MKKWHNERLSLWQPESTGTVCHQCIHPGKVGKYFAALKCIVEEVESAERVWNVDKTGLQLDVKSKKEVASKDIKYLHSRSSGNSEIISVIACTSAAGKWIPPHYIVKGKTERSSMGFIADVAPRGTMSRVSETGSTKQGYGFYTHFCPALVLNAHKFLF